MKFDGCGVAFGVRGVLFASGLEEQIDVVLVRLEQLTNRFAHVTLNAVGLSRGACACLMLAQRVANLNQVLVNLFVFDPVRLTIFFAFVSFVATIY